MTRAELLNVAKPILFNTEMVRAILEDRKTATRRCVKLPKWIVKQDDGRYTLFAEGTCYENKSFIDVATYLNKPYRLGDILYVRETWQCWRAHRYEATADIMFRAGGDGVRLQFENGNTDSVNRCDYDTFVNKWFSHNGEWKPSLFMPKEAARIFLKVKDVRVERLQDITEEDVKREGIEPRFKVKDRFSGDIAKSRFMELWDSTIQKADIERYGWEANPWVWVIEFERIKPEEV